MKHTLFQRYARLSTLLPLALAVATASFAVGTQTASVLRTIDSSSATETVRGDVNGDSVVDVKDAIVILEIAQGYRDATPSELAADPNDNGSLTVDDAIRLLRTITPR